MQYELIALIDPKVPEKDAENLLSNLLTKDGFTVDKVESLGKKLLAYPVKKKEEALFFIFQLTSDKNPNLLIPKFKLDETILRTLVLQKKNKKEKPNVS